MSRPKILPFQLEILPFQLDVNECNFGLPQLWAVIHSTLSMRIVTGGFPVQIMCIDEVNGIIAHNYGMLKLHSLTPSLRWNWKRRCWASTLSHKMCPRNQSTELKLLILVSPCLGEVTSYTDTTYYIHASLWGVCRSGIFVGGGGGAPSMTVQG